MQRTTLLCGVVLVLLAPVSAWAQTMDGPVSFPPPPPGLDGIGLPSGPCLDSPSLLSGPDRERLAAPATPTTNATSALSTTGAFNTFGTFGLFDPRLMSIFSVNYATTWFPSERVTGQPTHLGYLQDDFSLNLPLYHDGGDTWAMSIRGRNETFSTQAFLPQTQRSFPSDLWALTFGSAYAHQFDSGWVAGGGVNVGSASDELFHSIREMTVGVNAFLRVPSGERDFWMFSLSYSPTAEISFPIPMAAYVWNPSDTLRVNIGLPFQVLYRPTDDWTFNLSYMLLRTVHAQTAYRLSPWLRAHAGFDWGNESYFLADRTNVNDRLFYYDQRATAGLLFTVTNNFTIDLTSGYVFNRFYFVGAEYADKNGGQLDVGAGPYISLQGRLRW